MKLPHLFLVLVIIFDVVRNEVVAFESSSLRELTANLGDTVASFSDLFDIVLEFNTEVDDLYNVLDQAKNDSNRPTPAFTATLVNGGRPMSFRNNQTIKFQSSQVNVNGCYNTSTGVFKAPVTGLYYFSVIITQWGSEGINAVDIVAGDDQKILGHIYNLPSKDHFVESRIFYILAHLNAEEEVWVRCAHIDCSFYSDLDSYFSGFQLKL